MADITVTSDVDTFMQAANAAAMRSALGLGSLATQTSSSVSISGGTITGLTGFGIRSSGTGTFDLTIVNTENLTSGRTLTITVGDAARTLTLSGNLTVPATGTAALLGTANVFAAAQTISVNGAASTPALLGSGTIFTGGSATTTKPYWLIEPTGTTSTGWSTSGTLLGANAPNGFAGNLFDFQINGSSKFRYESSTNAIRFGGDLDMYASTVSRIYMAGNVFQVSFAGTVNFQCDNGGIFGVRSSMSLASTGSLNFSSTTSFGGTKDLGFARASAGVGRITDGSTGRGTLDAAGYQVGGVAGVSFSGVVTNLTIVNGIVTAAS